MTFLTQNWPMLLALVLVLLIPLGPLPLAMRAILHPIFGAAARRHWRGAAVGAMLGLLGAVVLATQTDWMSPVMVVVLGLLVLLAVMDLRWRWLPLEWCALIGVATVAQAFSAETVGATVLAMIVPAGIVAFIRWIFLKFRDVEVIGAGDLWLIAALSGQLGLQGSALLMGLAALTGLLSHLIYKLFFTNQAQRYGVAYGAHLCANFAVIESLGTAI